MKRANRSLRVQAMKDEDKTKEELLAELETLRRQVAELEGLQERIKSREEDLRRSEERFRTLADSTYDWESWRAPDGKYLYVSPSCERITGYRREEFMADPSLVARIVHPDDQGRHQQTLLGGFSCSGSSSHRFQDYNKNRGGALHQPLLPGSLREGRRVARTQGRAIETSP